MAVDHKGRSHEDLFVMIDLIAERHRNKQLVRRRLWIATGLLVSAIGAWFTHFMSELGRGPAAR